MKYIARHRTVLAALPILAQLGCSGPDMSGMDPSLATGVGSLGGSTTGDDDGELETGPEGKLDLAPASDLPMQDPEECVSDSAQAELVPKPVDVILFVDTSSSMQDVSNGVETSLIALLDAITTIESADVRVILVALYGTAAAMCVPAPLGPDDCMPPGPLAPVGPQLFQYSIGLGSGSFLDAIITTYTGEAPATASLYAAPPNGWQEWARPEAFKVIIGVTDAASMSTNPALGNAFDAELLALAPEQFGTPDARNYVLHAITAIGPNTPPELPWPPEAPLVVSECEGEPGQPLQQAAIITGGFRFGLCYYASFPALFDDIGVQAAELTPVTCDFAIPEAPEGETLDPDTFEVEYLPAGVAPGEVFHQVPSEGDCEADAFWVDATSIHLCAEVCAVVQADAMAHIDVRYGCDVGYEPNG